jgi:hypothetical protein
VEGEVVGGEEGDSLISMNVGNWFADTEIPAAALLLNDARVSQEGHERETAAVENWDFQVVDIDPAVVDSGGVKNRKQVLGGGNQDALAHETRGVGDAGDVLPGGGKGEVPKVGAEEDDAGSGGRGPDFDVYRDSVVQADT